mmetsp:Transcript_81016/g.203958  ORF Transcript_81016/g.203958 Transcript_81016/m.203958 type:complete len:319 (+) Transcript_81016:1696-2652(+)
MAAPLNGTHDQRHDVGWVQRDSSVSNVTELAYLWPLADGPSHLDIRQHEAAQDKEELCPSTAPSVVVEVAQHDLNRRDPPHGIQGLQPRSPSLWRRRPGLTQLIDQDGNGAEGKHRHHRALPVRCTVLGAGEVDHQGACVSWQLSYGFDRLPTHLQVLARVSLEEDGVPVPDHPAALFLDVKPLPNARLVPPCTCDLGLHINKLPCGCPQSHSISGVECAAIAAVNGKRLHPRTQILVGLQDDCPPSSNLWPSSPHELVLSINECTGMGSKGDVLPGHYGIRIFTLNDQGLPSACEVPLRTHQAILVAMDIKIAVHMR